MSVRIRVARRLEVSSRRLTLYKLTAVVGALVAAGVGMGVAGLPVFDFVGRTVRSLVAGREGIEQVFVLATPITILALAVYTAAAARLWNIGTEGQFFAGAIAATAVGYLLPGLGWISLACMFTAAMAAGAAWALIPALLRAYRGVNEIVTTLLMSFIAVQLTIWFSTYVWRDPHNTVLRASYRVDAALPFIPGSSILNVGVVVPVILIAIVAWLLARTRWGFEVRMVGAGPAAARYAGMPIEARLVGAMLLSGAIAGSAGMLQLAGTTQRLTETLSNQYGLSGLMIAGLAGAWAPGVLVYGLVIAIVFRAGLTLQASGFSTNVVFAIYGVVLAAVAVAAVAAGYRLTMERGSPTRPATAEEAPTAEPAPAVEQGTPWTS